MRPLHPVLAEVTARIVARSQGLRHAYLQRVEAMRQRPRRRSAWAAPTWPMPSRPCLATSG
jgi:hypothetical protein